MRVIAELYADNTCNERVVRIEAQPNDEFLVTLTISSSATGTQTGGFTIAADTLRDFREAIDVVLGDEEIEYE